MASIRPSLRPLAFTLTNFVIISIIVILAGMLLPTLGWAKETAKRTQCLNNTRQLGLAHVMYGYDQNNLFYSLRASKNRWSAQIHPYYREIKLLKCPSDKRIPVRTITQNNSNRVREIHLDEAPRSYIINGWNDYFEQMLSS
ncbi:MAG: hypothetical protein M2R45_01337 [Verrucomicrobia subdivision 3 bacterium]|nr:hypothetical protein [Limisphaerales bacterium]MCS1415203.1 hypothetical protein [Limisphaerales bacterium]